MRVSRLFLIVIAIVAWGSMFQVVGSELSLFPIAALTDLLSYPQPVPASERPAEQLLYVTTVSETDLAVVLRPITEEEYGSFQVQAIGYQIIERQMLAAAIVLPLVTEADITGFSPELVTFLEQQVNAISGFSVFSVPPRKGSTIR